MKSLSPSGRVFVRSTGRRIAPFGDPPGEVPILHRPLAQWQADAIRDAGLQQVDSPEPPCLVVPDTLFTTGTVLRRFVDGAAGRSAVLVLADSEFGRQTVPVQPRVERVEGGWRFDDVRFDAGDGAEPVPVVIDPEEKPLRVPVPGWYVGTDEVVVPRARHPVLTVHHWVHLLQANRAAGERSVRSMPTWRWVLCVAGAVLRARSLNRWRVLGKLNRVGTKCDIHPTAVVEGSALGDGVSVGPNARVLFSNLGDGAVVMAGAVVEYSVVGARAIVCQHCLVRSSLLYDESVAAFGVLQQSVLGRRVITGAGSWALDLNFRREVRVELDGELHGTGTRVLGCAIGHGAIVGSGVWIGSGRSVPAGAMVVRDPSEVLLWPPDRVEGDGPVRILDGGLAPVEARVRPAEAGATGSNASPDGESEEMSPRGPHRG